MFIVLCVLYAGITTTLSMPLHAQTVTTQSPSTLRLGMQTEPVQAVLSEVVAVFLEEQGYEVVRVPLATTTDLLDALTAGTIDLAMALPVDALTTHYQLPLNALPTDRGRVQQLVGSLGEKEGLVWSATTLAQRQPTLWATAPIAEQVAAATELPTAVATAIDNTSTVCAPVSQAGPLQGLLTGLAEEYGLIVPDDAIQLLDVPAVTAPANEQGITATLTTTLPITATPALTTTGVPMTETAATDGVRSTPSLTTTSTLTDSVVVADLSLASCDLLFDLSPSLIISNTELISGTELRPLSALAPLFPDNHPTLVVAAGVALETEPFFATLDQVLTAVDDQRLATLVNETITAPAPDRIPAAEWAYRFLLDRNLIALPTIAIGARAETAQTLLAAMVSLLLEEQGYNVLNQSSQLPFVSPVTTVMDGTIDLAIGLTGDLDFAIEDTTEVIDQSNLLGTVVEHFNERQSENGEVVAFKPAPFSLTQLLLVDEDLAALGITELSTLADYMNRYGAPLGICMDSDFFSHPSAGLSQVETAYGFQFRPEKILLMDDDSLFPAINEGRCQITIGTATDGRIAAWNLVALADDQERFVPNNPLPLIDKPLLLRHPNLQPLLESLFSRLDATVMQQMTVQVELGNDGSAFSGDEESPEMVARRYLLGVGLIGEDEGGQ